jgi:hypothetical protein
LLPDVFILDMLQGDPDDLPDMFDHVVDVFRRLFTVWIDGGLPRSGEMVSVL